MTDKLVELIAKYFEKLNPNSNHIIATQLAGYLRNNGVIISDAPVPMTNGDRIRAMGDEELAKIISDGGCPPKISEIVCETTDDCNVCWRNWLKQPAEVEHE